MPATACPTICPICPYMPESGRLDHLVRHIARKHPDVSGSIGRRANGLTFEALPGSDAIVFCREQKVAVCTRCAHPIHVSGYCKDIIAYFNLHQCRQKQVRERKQKTPKSDAVSVEEPMPTPSVSYEQLWDDMRSRLMTGKLPSDANLSKRWQETRKKLGEMMNNAQEFNMDDDVIDYKAAILQLMEDLAFSHPFATPVESTPAPPPAAPAPPVPPPPPPGPKPPAPVRGTIGFTIF